MNDGDSSSATRRWWLSPALARLAFGASTRGTHTQAPSAASMMERALLHAEMAGLDLDDPVQREFGDYELLELIGQGGMGVVYRARQRGLDREVAIKLLSAGQWAPAELVDGLRREAQHAAQLQHPNIVVIHEMGDTAGLIYYAMQLVRGRSLSQRLDTDGPLPPHEAARLLRTVAEAVDYAHRLGVLHLDLKPGNILLDERGTPLVADFGLARRLEQALDNDRVSGTPSYMAPEQAQVQGPPLSPATDVWALGAVLYELLTGQPPFDGGDPAATVRLMLDGEVRKPSRLAPVPEDLEAICLKCLAKDPAQRYPSARALADDLGRFIEGRAVSVRPLNAPQRVARWARREPRLATAASLAIVALLVGVIATSLQWRRADANATTSSTRLWESRREAALRLEQEGKGYEAMPRLLQNIEEQERTGHPDLAALDRRRLGMLAGQGAVLIDTMAIADANPLAVELSDDGSLLAIALNDLSVRWYDTTTLHERGHVSLQARVSSSGEARTPMLLRFAGNHHLRVTLEWVSNLVNPTDGDSWLVDLDHAAVVEPPAAFADFADAAYSADGRHALLRNREKRVQLWQVAPWKPLSALQAATSKARPDYLAWQLGPGARYAAMIRPGSRELLWHVLPDLTQAHPVRFPGEAGIKAWSHSHDGHWLALGDLEGRVFVMDTATRKLRTLPTSRGREITWLAFSEDDAWLAAASWDGTVYAFDVARGDSLVAGQMRHDFVLQRVGVSRSRRLLIAAGEGKTALWRLPESGPRAVPAQRIGAGPAEHGLTGRYPIAWSLQAGLLASAGLDGQVRLWRLPTSPMVPARAARQIAETLQFDGKHLIDVEWNHLRLVSVTGAAVTRWITLAQPPGFAELVDHGRTLIVTVGPELQVFDVPRLQRRFAPIALPSSPQRLLASSDSARILITFSSSGGTTGLQEQLQQYDLRSGRRMAGTAIVAGPLRMLAYSPDGHRVLAVGPDDATTTLLASAGLRTLAEYPHDPFQPVHWGAFANPPGNNIWLVTAAEDARMGSDALLRWNPASDVVKEHATGQARPQAVITTATGVFVAGRDQALLADEGGNLRKLERVAASTEATEGLAVSADGRLVARAFRWEVELYDATSGAAIGPPLQSDSNALDTISRLTFTPDGRQLLARTGQGHWLVWRLTPDMRPVKTIATQLARLDPGNENQQRVRLPSTGERSRLRAHDPGRWPSPSPRPAIPIQTFALADQSPIPARAPTTSPLLLDLGKLYASGPDGVRNTFFTIRSQMRPYPAGVQRFDGIDYDLRGMAEIGTLEWTDQVVMPLKGAHCIPVPQAVAAIHPLLLPVVALATQEPQTLATLTWRYRDGSRAATPLRTQHELPGYSGQDQAVPLVFATIIDRRTVGMQSETASAPRLRNPHPERALRCIDLEPVGYPLLVFAITVEPAAPDPMSGRPVILSGVIRTDRKGTGRSLAPASRPRAGASTPARRSP